MLKLIRLEYKKNRIGKYIRNALILTGALLVFHFAFVYLGIANDPETGVPDAAMDAAGVSASVELLTGIAFMIFAAVMHSSFTIGAYKNKTMDLMFSYPIERKKILAAKLAAVWLFSLAALLVTKEVIYAVIYYAGLFLKPAFIIDYCLFDVGFWLQTTVKAVMTISISFIALFAGMLLKSPAAAIVTSFLLIVLMNGNIGGATLAGNLQVPVILTIISFIFAVLSIQSIETSDIG